MVFRLVPAPGAIFVVIPIVIVLVVLIVDSDLNAGFLRHRDSHNCHWRHEGGGQEKRGEVTMGNMHVVVLQIPDIRSMKRDFH